MRVEIDGPVGRLVGELEEPDVTPRGLALVCHPHPAHGGSMRNTLVVRVARGLRAAGVVTLRFDFRGVGGSAGVHDGTQEIEDAAAAAGELAQRHPELPLWAAGYSFGARIAAELAGRDAEVRRLLLIAFPCRLYDPRFLADTRRPGLIVLGEKDPFGNAADLRRALPRLPPDLELVEIPGADHFFRGRTPLVEEATVRYARRAFETSFEK
jgi:alpha/beta superfamily hydrolase